MSEQACPRCGAVGRLSRHRGVGREAGRITEGCNACGHVRYCYVPTEKSAQEQCLEVMDGRAVERAVRGQREAESLATKLQNELRRADVLLGDAGELLERCESLLAPLREVVAAVDGINVAATGVAVERAKRKLKSVFDTMMTPDVDAFLRSRELELISRRAAAVRSARERAGWGR